MIIGQGSNESQTELALKVFHNIQEVLKKLGVYFDTNLNFEHHFKTLLDYCNTLFSTLNQLTLTRLQLVQNATARFLTN